MEDRAAIRAVWAVFGLSFLGSLYFLVSEGRLDQWPLLAPAALLYSLLGCVVSAWIRRVSHSRK